MDISKLKARKIQLEKDIDREVDKLLQEFSKDTNLVISNISIDVYQCSTMDGVITNKAYDTNVGIYI